MKVGGYRLKGYDATYDKTVFDVRTNYTEENCVLEILELNSGVTYILELDKRSKVIQPIRRNVRKKF